VAAAAGSGEILVSSTARRAVLPRVRRTARSGRYMRASRTPALATQNESATRAAVAGWSTTFCDQRHGRMCRRIGTMSVRDRVPGAEGRDPRSSEPNLRKVLGGGHSDVPLRGIMWVIEDHLRPSGHIMPVHAGDRGTVPSVLEPHDHLHISQERMFVSRWLVSQDAADCLGRTLARRVQLRLPCPASRLGLRSLHRSN
jgi:hypothetical protein